MTKIKQKLSGAICGGSREYAEKLVREAHCKKHKKPHEECEKCLDAFIQAVDENFMALM